MQTSRRLPTCCATPMRCALQGRKNWLMCSRDYCAIERGPRRWARERRGSSKSRREQRSGAWPRFGKCWRQTPMWSAEHDAQGRRETYALAAGADLPAWAGTAREKVSAGQFVDSAAALAGGQRWESFDGRIGKDAVDDCTREGAG